MASLKKYSTEAKGEKLANEVVTQPSKQKISKYAALIWRHDMTLHLETFRDISFQVIKKVRSKRTFFSLNNGVFLFFF